MAQRLKLRTAEFTGPEIGTVNVRCLKLSERLKLSEMGGADFVLALLETTVDNDYTAEDWDYYGGVYQSETLALIRVAQSLSALDDEARTDAKKK